MVEKIFIIFVLLLVINNCVKMEPKFGKEFNEERKIVGLPIIPDNWELYTVARDYSVWVNPERQEAKHKNRIPVHWSKGVGYRTGDIISENDIYYGKEDYTTCDGTFREDLTIRYNFKEDDYDSIKVIGWSCYLSNRDTEVIGEDIIISLKEAEKVLEKWGIKRLSYDFTKTKAR